MNKFSIALAALSLVTVSQAFANYLPGRVDAVVVCNTNTVNGITLEVTRQEGSTSYQAAVFHGGVVGNTKVAGPLEVKFTTKNYITTVIDTETAGQKLNLVIDSTLRPYHVEFNARTGLNFDLAKASNLQMECLFPVHTM